MAHPNKIAVGGHSYGAFMTANLLAHAPHLFCCGIARSGAYNRTLTPFGFQVVFYSGLKYRCQILIVVFLLNFNLIFSLYLKIVVVINLKFIRILIPQRQCYFSLSIIACCTHHITKTKYCGFSSSLAGKLILWLVFCDSLHIMKTIFSPNLEMDTNIILTRQLMNGY